MTGAGTSHQLWGTTHLTTGTQYFLVATYNGATASLYLNGSLQTTLSATGSLYYPGGGLGLARKYSTSRANFTGTERGVAIYGTALAADRVAAQYQAGSPPTVPTSFAASGTSTTQINLSWAASTDAVGVTGYLIERCPGNSCTNFTQIANGTSTSYSDTGLTASTNYTYRIRAVNSGNNVSDYSSAANSTTLSGGGDTTPPTAPTAPSATANSSTQITLTWTASIDNVGVTGYRVERCQGSGCASFTQIATPTGSPYVDSGLSAASAYSYRVRATDAAGNLGAYSSTASATTATAADTTPPTAPTGPSAAAVSGSQINVSWTASTDNVGVTGYRLKRCQGTGCTTFAQIATPAASPYSDVGLSASSSYSYRVRATDAAGNLSAYSSVASATTQGVPAAPTGLVVSAASTEVDLIWSAGTGGSGAAGYRVERCQGDSCSSFTQVAAPTGAFDNDPGLTPSTAYSYRVRAADNGGNLSGYSNVVTNHPCQQS